MLARRNWLLRASIFINAAVLLYFASYLTIRNGAFDLVDDVQLQSTNKAVEQLQQESKQVAAIVYSEPKQQIVVDQQQNRSEQKPPAAPQDHFNPDEGIFPADSAADASGTGTVSGGQQQPQPVSYAQQSQQQPVTNAQGTTTQGRTTKVSSTLKTGVEAAPSSECVNVLPEKGFTVELSKMQKSKLQDLEVKIQNEESTNQGTVSEPSLSEIIKCTDKNKNFRIDQKGDFWVLYNYVPAKRSFHCWQSITYTTHADFTFLDNLQPLIERWQGPISLALYAPGTDFAETLKAIRYLRACTTDLVTEYVTFHIYFGSKHVPKIVPPVSVVVEIPDSFNCSEVAPWYRVTQSPYRSHRKLLYPVNVGRNIARSAAETHYVFASDIELYPSPGIIPDFMEMIKRQDPPLLRKNPKVFPIAIFEVDAHAKVPSRKSELVSMLKNNTAITFHKRVCSGCHNVPKSREWINAPQKPGLHVFHIGKRLGNFVHWEPIFIGTHSDPYYDERLSWEGRSDKMTQGYVLCVLDYEFHILDNAFLVHKPGIKHLKKDTARDILTGKTNMLIRKVILPELKALYGSRKGCSV